MRRPLALIIVGIPFLALVLLMSPNSISAVVMHSGTLTDNETWGAGTHPVNGGVTVPKDSVLTISAGAVVKFSPPAQY